MNRNGILWNDGDNLDPGQVDGLLTYTSRHPGSTLDVTVPTTWVELRATGSQGDREYGIRCWRCPNLMDVRTVSRSEAIRHADFHGRDPGQIHGDGIAGPLRKEP